MSESIFRVKLLPDGRLEYEDCLGRVVQCTAQEAGPGIAARLRDSDLPPVEVLNSGGHNVVEAAARTLLPPEYQPLLRAAHPVMQLLQSMFRAAGHPQPGRYHQQHQHQHQANANPGTPRPGAYRRGQRVA